MFLQACPRGGIVRSRFDVGITVPLMIAEVAARKSDELGTYVEHAPIAESRRRNSHAGCCRPCRQHGGWRSRSVARTAPGYTLHILPVLKLLVVIFKLKVATVGGNPQFRARFHSCVAPVSYTHLTLPT